MSHYLAVNGKVSPNDVRVDRTGSGDSGCLVWQPKNKTKINKQTNKHPSGTLITLAPKHMDVFTALGAASAN